VSWNLVKHPVVACATAGHSLSTACAVQQFFKGSTNLADDGSFTPKILVASRFETTSRGDMIVFLQGLVLSPPWDHPLKGQVAGNHRVVNY